jgi:enoyl-CoA hydratase/carnithine racemase
MMERAIIDKFIIFEKRDGMAVITLNRPHCLNAWHTPMRTEITERLKQCNSDATVRAVVMTGAGHRAFCAGQDLNETKEIQGAKAGLPGPQVDRPSTIHSAAWRSPLSRHSTA